VIDKTGSLAGIKRHDFLPFGEELSAGVGIRSASNGYDADSVRQKFGSYERDNETGLDYFGARYFSSIQGRFTSPDWSPLLVPVPYADLNDPQTINRYSYVRNNPLWRMDKDGHDWDWWKKLKNWATNGGWTADDQEAAKTRRERQVNTARFFANEWAKEHPNAKFDQSKYSDDQIVKLFQNGAFSKTANDPLDPLQIFGMVMVFRGGPSLEARDIDIKIDKQTGLVQPGRGVSVNADPTKVERFGGAYKIDMQSVPPELEVIQHGVRDPGHYEIAPRQPMTPARYQELLDKVKLTPVKPPSQ
jgi:RHS repeat-associated protein